MSDSSFLLGFDDDVAFVTAIDGTVSLTPGSPITSAAAPEEQALSIALYDDADAFYVPVVAPALWSAETAIYDDADTFYAPGLVSMASVSAEAHDDTDTVHASDIEATSQAAAEHYSDPDEFHAPGIEGLEPIAAQALSPPLYTELLSVSASYLLSNEDAAFITNADGTSLATGIPISAGDSSAPGVEIFYAPSLEYAQVVSAALYDDADVFTASAIGFESGEQTISADLFDDVDAFYVALAELPGAEQALAPELYVDADVFHASGIGEEGQVELPPMRPPTAMRRRPRKLPHPQFLAPALYIDPDVIYAPSIKLTEDEIPAPSIQPEQLPLPLPLLTSLRRRSREPVVSAKVRIVTPNSVIAFRKVESPDRIISSAIVSAGESDEEIMLILLEAA